jgi:hypothetical protein
VYIEGSQIEENIMAQAQKVAKAANYTSEMVERMLARYEELGNEGLETIAAELGKPVRSVRSKLVREGVYVAAEKPKAQAKVEGPSKKDLLNELEALVDFSVDGFMGATKDAIASVIALARSVKAD